MSYLWEDGQASTLTKDLVLGALLTIEGVSIGEEVVGIPQVPDNNKWCARWIKTTLC